MVDLTLRTVFAYLSGISLGFVGLLLVIGTAVGGGSVLGGFIVIAAGVFALPVVRRQLDAQANVSFSTILVVVLVLGASITGFVLVGLSAVPADDATASTNAGADGNNAAGQDSGDSEAQPEATTHAVDESFQVGSGDQAVEYTVTSVRTAGNLGGQYGEDASGEYVVVVMQMENLGGESFDIGSNLFTLVDSQDREYDVDTDAQVYLENGILFEQLNPGLSTRGAVVFDVPPDQQGRELKIEPAGMFSDAEPHYVELEES